MKLPRGKWCVRWYRKECVREEWFRTKREARYRMTELWRGRIDSMLTEEILPPPAIE